MDTRIAYAKVSPDAIKALYHLEEYINKSGLEVSLLNLVKMRASLLNGCTYCVDFHSKDALKAGETDRRLFAVSVWREAPFFTERERAALEWTEVITLIADSHAPDEVYEKIKKHFSEKEMVDLTMAIATINSWNRIAIGFRQLPKE